MLTVTTTVQGSITLTNTSTLILRSAQLVVDGNATVAGTVEVTLDRVALDEFIPLVTVSGVNSTLFVDDGVRVEVVSGTPDVMRPCEELSQDNRVSEDGRSFGVVFSADQSNCNSESSNIAHVLVAVLVPVCVVLVCCVATIIILLFGVVFWSRIRHLLWRSEKEDDAVIDSDARC